MHCGEHARRLLGTSFQIGCLTLELFYLFSKLRATFLQVRPVFLRDKMSSWARRLSQELVFSSLL